MDEADPIAGQLLVTHLLYTVQDLFSTARQSSFQNSFHTLRLVFGGPSLSNSQIKTEDETSQVKPPTLWVSCQIHKRGRCGGRQCSNVSPIFFFLPSKVDIFLLPPSPRGQRYLRKKFKQNPLSKGVILYCLKPSTYLVNMLNIGRVLFFGFLQKPNKGTTEPLHLVILINKA